MSNLKSGRSVTAPRDDHPVSALDLATGAGLAAPPTAGDAAVRKAAPGRVQPIELALKILPRRDSLVVHQPPVASRAPERLRFMLHDWSDFDRDGREVDYRTAVRQDNGAGLSSLLTTGEHAPVVTAGGFAHCSATATGTTVTFEGRFRTRTVLEHLDWLVDLGLVLSVRVSRTVTGHDTSRGTQLRPRIWSPIARSVQVNFPFIVEARPSISAPGHTDLFFQTPMDQPDSFALARSLRRAGLVSVLDAESADEGEFTFIYRPH